MFLIQFNNGNFRWNLFNSILISFLALYRTHFYKKVGLLGQIHSWDSDFVLQGQYFNNIIECSFVNYGNQELLIREVSIASVKDDNLIPELKTGDIPIVVKPSEIKIIHFSISENFAKVRAEMGENITLNFDVISSDGNVRVLKKELQCNQNGLVANNKTFSSFKF